MKNKLTADQISNLAQKLAEREMMEGDPDTCLVAFFEIMLGGDFTVFSKREIQDLAEEYGTEDEEE